jgi:hypothetical protein
MDISPQDIITWRKKIELIGIDIKGLEQDADPGRLKLKTKFMNRHFINELDKIGLQLIHITGTYMGKLNVLSEARECIYRRTGKYIKKLPSLFFDTIRSIRPYYYFG